MRDGNIYRLSKSQIQGNTYVVERQELTKEEIKQIPNFSCDAEIVDGELRITASFPKWIDTKGSVTLYCSPNLDGTGAHPIAYATPDTHRVIFSHKDENDHKQLFFWLRHKNSGDQRFLDFPIKGSDPFTHRVTSIMDHDGGAVGVTDLNGVKYPHHHSTTFDGGTTVSAYMLLPKKDDNVRVSFEPFFNHSPPTPIEVNYDGHTGYDYGGIFNDENGKLCAPADGYLYFGTTNKVDNPNNGETGTTIWRPKDSPDMYHTNDVWTTLHYVYIVHDNGYITGYSHCDRVLGQNSTDQDTIWRKLLKEGKVRLKRGQHFAFVGTKGTGDDHLHFEVQKKSSPQASRYDVLVDPYGTYDKDTGEIITPMLWRATP